MGSYNGENITETRPSRRQPDEVRCVCEIKAHTTYWGRKDGTDRDERIHAISKPYQRPDGQWWVKVESEYKHNEERSIADMGVTPDNTGKWHKRNYLVTSPHKSHRYCGVPLEEEMLAMLEEVQAHIGPACRECYDKVTKLITKAKGGK